MKYQLKALNTRCELHDNTGIYDIAFFKTSQWQKLYYITVKLIQDEQTRSQRKKAIRGKWS